MTESTSVRRCRRRRHRRPRTAPLTTTRTRTRTPSRATWRRPENGPATPTASAELTSACLIPSGASLRGERSRRRSPAERGVDERAAGRTPQRRAARRCARSRRRCRTPRPPPRPRGRTGVRSGSLQPAAEAGRRVAEERRTARPPATTARRCRSRRRSGCRSPATCTLSRVRSMWQVPWSRAGSASRVRSRSVKPTVAAQQPTSSNNGRIRCWLVVDQQGGVVNLPIR